ncbi:hypothetical protein RD1_0732 [Roseobacter denitrificans OCh 114]|uniref:Uncharacterized protein n=1 Tax=Roseobacter denitrificans (strain ATCC 33942 / OCh 114) TaxID=375451 RepID=Q16C76_ROSDO|nr:hypothetical protein RD1_0732 [Roseobacter denitrificans OCh 114]
MYLSTMQANSPEKYMMCIGHAFAHMFMQMVEARAPIEKRYV